MRDKQQTGLVKFKRLVLHPALAALCAADAAGYYVTQMRLNAPAPEAAVPAYASAVPSYRAPVYGPPDFAEPNASVQDRASVSFALPQEFAPGPLPVADPQTAPDRQLATSYAAAAPAVIGGITPKRTLGVRSTPALHAAAKVASAPGKHAAAHAAAAFDRAFPAHFSARHRVVTSRAAYPEAAALQASAAERVPDLIGFDAPLPAAFDLRASGDGTAELSPAGLTAPPATPLSDPAALTQPMQSGDFDAAGQPGLPLGLALPLSQTLPLNQTRAPAGGTGTVSDPGTAAIRLSDLLRAFEPAMDRAEFVRLINSPHTAALVTLDTLRSAGIPLHYDAAGKVVAPGGIEIGITRLG